MGLEVKACLIEKGQQKYLSSSFKVLGILEGAANTFTKKEPGI